MGQHIIIHSIAKPAFELYAHTVTRIREFQEKYPDVTIEECSQYVNSAIIEMINLYEMNRAQLEDAHNEFTC